MNTNATCAVRGRYRCAFLPVGILASLAIAVLAGGCSTTPADGSSEPTPPPDDTDNVAIAREIEEADIIKQVGDYLYLSNPYTGLRIIDVGTIEQPELVGTYPLTGRGIELIVRDDYAFVLTAADFGYCAGEPVGFDEDTWSGVTQPGYTGSRLWVIDVSDKTAPALVQNTTFAGSTVGTRRVGDIIYVTGNIGSSVFVLSFDISDPSSPALVDNQQITGDALDIHVSGEAIYVVGNDETMADTSIVTYVDITDTNGLVDVRNQFRVPGRVLNRYFMDAYQRTFRIVTEELVTGTFNRVVSLYTYDVTDPDNVERLARLPLVTDESLRSVRFDGDRGYAVTYRTVDPLFVLDLSDPENPEIAGELTVPGYSTHLVPLGDRLVGVGFDGTSSLEPAVSLYDVTNPASPKQLSRIVLTVQGGGTVTSEATVDEKALRVIEDANLIMLPYAYFDEQEGAFVDKLQFIELQPQRLIQRGTIQHRGLVRRSDLLDTRVWLLSDLAFQVVDIDDLGDPQSIESLDLITDQELLDAGLTDCVDSARFHGTDLGFFFFWDGPFLCGAFSPAMMLLTIAGLVALRQRFWSRQSSG